MTNFNGTITDKEQVLSIQNRGYAYGDSLFETIKVSHSKLFFWEDHYFRLMASMRMLRMKIPMEFTLEFLQKEILKTVAAQDNAVSYRVRLNIYRKDGGLYTPKTNEIDYLIDVKKNIYITKEVYKVDIFKLESPVHSNDLEGEISQATEEAFKDLSNATNNKPWVVLSSGMGKDSFYKCLELAYKNGASGYLAGRTIWLDAFNQYPNIELVEEGLKVNSISYVNKLNELTAKKAQSLETYFNNGFKIDSPEQFSNNFGGFV